mmetsp:Transcript_4538/g.5254  ORF Transcript_4538/g.5254 Transcript_4538/m.5254 type:complete len:117 (-) Transcript_4538:139-489(-)|eukprot:CAMPEP_0194146822 /NCGR_PEP_ID=MMETSP0152-20130528/21942_1 /TAXON_ID=1049557 /ORGANISM="Thalassiothrix antarctica, Strain L6-D1" /LENGTH=116 /DNA_ID=CAMNT_0038847451 /DNA_START=74 /DNA_END=424 /DNA_ORIENTATION=+
MSETKEITKVEEKKSKDKPKPGIFKKFFTHIHCAGFFGCFLLMGLKSEHLNLGVVITIVAGLIALYIPPFGLNPMIALGAEPIYANEINKENEEIRKEKEKLERAAKAKAIKGKKK